MEESPNLRRTIAAQSDALPSRPRRTKACPPTGPVDVQTGTRNDCEIARVITLRCMIFIFGTSHSGTVPADSRCSGEGKLGAGVGDPISPPHALTHADCWEKRREGAIPSGSSWRAIHPALSHIQRRPC
jgi:hypothetical protein